MSVENLKKYGKLCAENDEVRKKAKEIGINDIDGQIAYGKSLGLEFSKEDFKELSREAELEVRNELSEEELRKVAGGVGTITFFVGLVVCGLVAGAGFSAVATKPGW
jgi:predicted ribosomally synthesized peptide with nif11-like leader